VRGFVLATWALLVAACTDRETLFATTPPPTGAASAAHAPASSSDAADGDGASAEAARMAPATSGPRDAGAVVALAPPPSGGDEESIDALVAEGDAAMGRHKPAEALAAYERALAADPSDGWALVRASEALVAMARSEEARTRLQGFVKSHPDAIPDAFDALGWIENDRRDVVAATAAFRKALDVSKGGDADAWYGMAVVAADSGDAKQVEQALRHVFELDPGRRDEARGDDAFESVRQSTEWKQLFELSP
jgi:tetratricopeptide (TPR) repeat protein